MANDSAYGKFVNKLSSGGTLVIRNVITGEVTFTLAGKTYFLGCNQTLNLSNIASLRELKQAMSLHGLIRQGYIRVE